MHDDVPPGTASSDNISSTHLCLLEVAISVWLCANMIHYLLIQQIKPNFLSFMLA